MKLEASFSPSKKSVNGIHTMGGTSGAIDGIAIGKMYKARGGHVLTRDVQCPGAIVPTKYLENICQANEL
jgi:hypothetical protein